MSREGEEVYVPVTVRLRKTETGEVREYRTEECEDGVGYQWTDGNYGCDCNRERFFLRAGGEEDVADEALHAQGRCSTGRYVVESITKESGEVIYRDGAP